MNWIRETSKSPPQSREEVLEERMACWVIMNGPVFPFEEQRYRKLHTEFLDRLKHPESLNNHFLAIQNSLDMIRTVPRQVTVPTLVIHGSEDPILPPDHGEALSAAIANSRYVCIPGFGHSINQYLYGLLIQEIKQHADQILTRDY